jgi:hypothetical protein
MIKILCFLILFLTQNTLSAAGLTASSVEPYSAWVKKNEAFLKDCASEGIELQKTTTPGTMLGTQQKNIKSQHIPTLQLNREGLPSDVLTKYDAIERLAKGKALSALKQSPKAKMFSEDRIKKTNGFALAMEADLVPEDYLRSFDYKKSCECRYTSSNIVPDETTYNTLPYQEFMKREERNRIVCLVKSASF